MNLPHLQYSSFDSGNLSSRNIKAKIWNKVFIVSTIVGVIALTALLINILDSVLGYVVIDPVVNPTTLAINGVMPNDMTHEQLVDVLQSNLSTAAYKKLEREKTMALRSRADILNLVNVRVIKYRIIKSWSLSESLFKRTAIKEYFSEIQIGKTNAELKFKSWINLSMILNPQTSEVETSGIRTAILGSFWTIIITLLVAFPLGVGAAVYLEEYADDNQINRLIRTNINNLAGVPSIIYGILGLAIFVRLLEPLTSGAIFHANAASGNGRTILSAGLTLALLVLPLIIINSQEAIHAVPQSLRKASYALGATKWQTIWSHVIPNALSGILTGSILAISRAIGETAPLIVIGASTAISFDPTSPFSKFTTLPIQIYQWTARPQAEWRHLAGASILVLLVLLISMNMVAILLRNRYGNKY